VPLGTEVGHAAERIWSLDRTSLNVSVKGQKVTVTREKNALCTPITCRSDGMERNALAANDVTQQQTEPFRLCGDDFGRLRAVCVR